MVSHYGININDQILLDTLLKQIKQMYEELKNCQYKPVQVTIIASLKPKCQQTIQLLDKNQLVSPNIKKKNQITQIKNKIEEIQSKIRKQEKVRTQYGRGGRHHEMNKNNGKYDYRDLKNQFGSVAAHKMSDYSEVQEQQINSQQQQNIFKAYHSKRNKNKNTVIKKDGQAQKQQVNQNQNQSSIYQSSRRIMRSIAFHEMKSVHLKYTKQQLDEVLKRMENNKQVMKAIESMLLQQGNNVEKISQNIEKVYENVQEANVELNQAQKQQMKHIGFVSRIFRNTASGFWGVISWPFKKFFHLFKKKS